MTNINLSTNDISEIIKCIKNKLNQIGGDCIITPDDLNNIPIEQHDAIEKLKLKFGNGYINKINEIKNDYIDLKGGIRFGSKGFKGFSRPRSRTPPRTVSFKATSLSASPRSPGRMPMSQRFKKTSTGLLSGLTGQATYGKSGQQTRSSMFGQLLAPIARQAIGTASQAIQDVGAAGRQRIVSTIQGQPYQQQSYQQQPQLQQQQQPEQIEIETEQVQECIQALQQEQQKTKKMEQQILGLQNLVRQLQQQRGGNNNIMNESDTAELLKNATNICNKVNMHGGNPEAGEVSSSIFLPMNLQQDTETEQNAKVPKVLVANSLYTIDS